MAKKSKRKEKKLVYKDTLSGQQKYDVSSFVQDDLDSEIEVMNDTRAFEKYNYNPL